MDYTKTKLYYGIVFWAIGINVTYNDVTMVLALNRISALLLNYSLDKCLLLCEVSQKSIRRISRYLGISIKRV